MTKSLKNLLVSAGILIAVFAAGFFTAMKTLGPDPAYWVKRAKYDADVKARDEKLAAAIAVIEGKDVLISAKDVEIAEKANRIKDLQGDDDAASSTIASLEEMNLILREDAAAVIAVNPAVRALIANYDAQIAESKKVIFSLRAQIVELGPPRVIGYDEAGKPILAYPEGSITFKMNEKFLATAVQRDAWKTQYDDEHATRLIAEGLVSDNEKRLATNKFWTYAGWTVAGIFGGIELYHGIRRK